MDLEPCGALFTARAGFRQRAGAATRRRNLAVYCIEGETLTLAQMAERLGVSESTVSTRLKRAAGMDGPVTWARLQGGKA